MNRKTADCHFGFNQPVSETDKYEGESHDNFGSESRTNLRTTTETSEALAGDTQTPCEPTEGRSNAHYGRLLGEGSCLSAQHLSGCRQVERLSGKYEAGFADHCQLRIESQREHDQRVSDLQKG